MKASMVLSLLAFPAIQLAPECFADTPSASPTANIASSAARFPRNADELDQLFNQVKNWERWGPEDQLGAANLITEKKRKQAFALVKLGRVIGLAHPLLTEPAVDNARPLEHKMFTWGLSEDSFFGGSGESYKISPHGEAHSHLDALCHIAYKGRLYNGYLAKEVITDKGCAKLGIDNFKDGIVTRGILIDIPRLKNLPYLEPGTPIFVEDLEAWEKKAGVKISAGDAIFLRTGRWARRAKLGPWSVGQSQAGVHASVAPWLKARGVSFVGSDGGFEVMPSMVEGTVPTPVHVLAMVALGIAIFDHQDLEVLAETAASLNRWEFLLSAAPMLATGGTGAPVNPLAIF